MQASKLEKMAPINPSDPQDNVIYKRQGSELRHLTYLTIFVLLIQAFYFGGVYAKETNDNQVTYRDFNLNIGDRIDVGDYQAELIEIQSTKDGLVVIRVSKVGGALDEQRAFLQNSANNFDGGSENGGITITLTDIPDDQSAKVRIEYQEILGTASKHVSEKPATPRDLPRLSVQESFDRNQMNVGDEVKVTIAVKNIGTGQALDIKAEDTPPLPEFSYIAGYPPKIKETLDPGESDSAVYLMSAVKEGSIRVPAIQVSYADSKKNARSNNSEPFNVLINPKSKANLAIDLTTPGPIQVGGKGVLNVSLSNMGTATAARIELEGEIRPPEGLEVAGLDKSFFEILPKKEVNYSAVLSGKSPGNYTVRLKASFDGGDGAMIQEGTTEVVVLEQEYKYQYLLLIIPIIVIIAWMYRRYKEYKY
jgi:uncharacterized repeat protein (TIGR01451 family)